MPAQFRVLVVRRPKYACRTCEDVVVQVPAPARLIEGGLPTEATVAQVNIFGVVTWDGARDQVAHQETRDRSVAIRIVEDWRASGRDEARRCVAHSHCRSWAQLQTLIAR